VRLSYHEVGEGRPVVLIHGHQDRGSHWIESGLAGLLAERGYRVIMPDLRGHGDSAKPHIAEAYPPDVLTDDGFELVGQLGLTDYDLAGHSLGGRTVLRMLARGATPRRAVVSGQGLEALLHAADRTGWYRKFFSACGTGVFEPGSDEQETQDWLLANGGDPQALLLALDSWVNTKAEELASVTVPVLILTGTDDWHNQTGNALAAALPNGSHVEVPGDHFTAEESPEYREALTGFLAR
jgi:pimeloyl-ACP methyl ester carboxylesterase